MASGTDSGKFEENLTCPLCLELFDEKVRIPKALPCIHTVCFTCLIRYVQSKPRGPTCPLCQGEFTVPPGGVQDMPTNIGLQNMLEFLPQGTEDDRKDSKEEVDGAETGLKSMKLGADKEEDIQKLVVCQLHDGSPCSFICMDCKVGLCSSCVTSLTTGSHSNHRLADGQKGLEEIKEEVKGKVQRLDEILKKQEEAADGALARAVAWKEPVKDEVHERVDRVVANISQWQDETLTEIESLFDRTAVEISGMRSLTAAMGKNLQLEMDDALAKLEECDLKAAEKLGEFSKKLDELNFDMESSLVIPAAKLSGWDIPTKFGDVVNKNIQIILAVPDIDMIKNEQVNSDWVILRNTNWRIYCSRYGRKYLTVYLECTKDSAPCKVELEVKLMLGNPDGLPTSAVISRTTHFTFYNPETNNLLGWTKFVDWKTVVEQGEGGPKGITVVAAVTIDPAK